MPQHYSKHFTYIDALHLHNHIIGEVRWYHRCPHFTFCFLISLSVWGARSLPNLPDLGFNMCTSQLICFPFYHFPSSKIPWWENLQLWNVIFNWKMGLRWEILKVMLKSITFVLWSPWNNGKWLKTEIPNMLNENLEMILCNHSLKWKDGTSI